MASILDRQNSVAPPGFNRFRVLPAAIAVHLAIGQVFAFAAFNLPLTRLIGGNASAPGDWDLKQVGSVFSIAIAFLGISGALFGRWVEAAGPRKSIFTAALCFGGGFLVAAVGVYLHQLWVLYLGYGVLLGSGVGIGYISPISTLIKWFPDRPGMATGLAIMGFAGGALLAAHLSVSLVDHFKTTDSNGVPETFVTLGVMYFLLMMIGVYAIRVPAADWKPAGWTAPTQPRQGVTTANVAVAMAWRTPQFWLLWVLLCTHVTAGIGVLSQASPMIQETFGGRVSAGAAAGYIGLISLFNVLGRFLWGSASDFIGRRNTYMICFLLGILLYAVVPTVGHQGSIPLFVAAFCIMFSITGGGFAAFPAYLRDLFGTYQVGAIHGRLLTAWATAVVLGPVLVSYIRQYQSASGVPNDQAYSAMMYVMCGLLLIGFLCNFAIRAVDAKYFHHGADDTPLA